MVMIFYVLCIICSGYYLSLGYSCCWTEAVAEPKFKHFRTNALAELDFDLLLSPRFALVKQLEKFFYDAANKEYLKVLAKVEREFRRDKFILGLCANVRKSFHPLVARSTLFEAPGHNMGILVRPHIAYLLVSILQDLNIEYDLPIEIIQAARG